MIDNPRIFVGTLFSGENEFSQCVSSLEQQNYSNWEHRVFRYLPNVEAHRTLYQTIMDCRDEFDLFIKLDADMVFSRPTSLEEIVSVFRQTPALDHAVFGVTDWYSNTMMMGMHVYSSRVKWSEMNDRLFVDPAPQISGERRFIWDQPAPIAAHSPDPSPTEAYLFGVHRALKVLQRNKRRLNMFQARFQLRLLRRIWREFCRHDDFRRGLVLFGAEQVFEGKITELEDKASQHDVEEWVRDLESRGPGKLRAQLAPYWGNALRYAARFTRYVVLNGLRSRLTSAFPG